MFCSNDPSKNWANTQTELLRDFHYFSRLLQPKLNSRTRRKLNNKLNRTYMHSRFNVCIEYLMFDVEFSSKSLRKVLCFGFSFKASGSDVRRRVRDISVLLIKWYLTIVFLNLGREATNYILTKPVTGCKILMCW